MPEDKNVEERRQTRHKLEVMERYWGAWCAILARARGQFCTDHLWLIDTHAGRGLHLSAGDPDGVVPGTPLQAVLAARAAQRRFPGLEAHVRATDKEAALATELERRLRHYRGGPPDGIDVVVKGVDWASYAPTVIGELRFAHAPLRGRQRIFGVHPHLSLWFVDPYGIESLDHDVLANLPGGAEAIVNLDVMGAMRLIGKADAGDDAARDILDTAFGGRSWEGHASGAAARPRIATAFAESFPTALFRRREIHALRPSGSQDRFLIHLTRADRAVEAFARTVRSALEVETLLAGRKLSKIEKDRAAMALHGLYAGQALRLEEMRGSGGFGKDQLRVICRAADQLGYGHWDEASTTMNWFEKRAPEPTLFD